MSAAATGTNHLELFRRVPSELRKYRKYIARIKDDYGSVMDFILKERVKWAEVVPKGAPFQCPGQSDLGKACG